MLPSNIEDPCNCKVMKNELTQFNNLAGYKVGDQIGKGRWGTVKVLTENDNDKTATSSKKLAIKLVADNKNRRDQLLNEFKIVTIFNHFKNQESMITYYQLFSCPDTKQLGVAMEYLEGPSIRSYVGQISQLETYLRQLLEVISDLHCSNIVHRDIKCDNIVIVDQGQRLKLIDFNLSVSLLVNPADSYFLNGTAKHYSPELIEWKKIREKHASPTKLINLLKKADIWSIGLMFYKLVSQRLAFTGENLDELHQRILQGHFVHLPKDSIMNRVINLCLTTNAKERPSAYDLHQMLIPNDIRDTNYQVCTMM
jgi:serine/threonine protein kinase